MAINGNESASILVIHSFVKITSLKLINRSFYGWKFLNQVAIIVYLFIKILFN